MILRKDPRLFLGSRELVLTTKFATESAVAEPNPRQIFTQVRKFDLKN